MGWGGGTGGMLTGPDRTLKPLLQDQDQVYTFLDEAYIFSMYKHEGLRG